MGGYFKHIGTERADRIANCLLNRVNSNEICRLEGVSKRTVSRVRRNDCPQVSAELRTKLVELFGHKPATPSRYRKPLVAHKGKHVPSVRPSSNEAYVLWLEDQNRRLVEVIAAMQGLIHRRFN